MEIIGAAAFRGATGMTEITIPNTVTTLKDRAFFGCNNLTSVTLPSSVATIEGTPFGNCMSLVSLTVESGNPVYHSENNCVIKTATQTVVIGCKTSQIPTSVTAIGSFAFWGASPVEVIIPGNVTSIASGAFSVCNAMTTFVAHEGLTTIGNNAFQNCQNLKTVVLPKSLTQIVSAGFRGCNNLTDVYYTGTEAEWKANVQIGTSNNPLLNATMHFEYTLPAYHAHEWSEWKETVAPKCGVDGEMQRTCSVADCDKVESKPIIATPHSYGDDDLCDTCGATRPLAYSELADGTLAVSGIGEFTGTKIVIPAEFNGKKVTAINSYAFQDNDKITSVVISEGITDLGYSVFQNCDALVSVSIPSTITKWGRNAFASCTALTTVNFAQGLTSIGAYSFSYDSALVSVTIPEGVTSVGAEAFWDCSSLKNLYVPSTLTELGRDAFGHNIAGTVQNVTKDENGLIFLGNESNPKLILVNVDRNVFANVSSEKFQIPSGVRFIYDGAFGYNSNIVSLEIPEGVRSIGHQSLMSLEGLTELSIPASVTSISDNAFSYLSSLDKITVAEGNQKYYVVNECLIDKDTKTLIFAYKNSKIPDDGSVEIIGTGAFWRTSGITEIIIPEGVTTIQREAIYSCMDLTLISLPTTVTSIEYSAIVNCSALTDLTVKTGNPVYLSHDCCIIETETNKLVLGCATSRIPSYVTAIRDHAFQHVALEEIVIPEKVISIGFHSFAGCSATSFVAYEGLTTIYDFAVQSCRNLKTVVLPKSLTEIGSFAFSFCDNLTDVYYAGTEAEWNANVRIGSMNDPLKNATMHFEYDYNSPVQ